MCAAIARGIPLKLKRVRVVVDCLGCHRLAFRNRRRSGGYTQKERNIINEKSERAVNLQPFPLYFFIHILTRDSSAER